MMGARTMPKLPTKHRETALGYVLPDRPVESIPDMPWDLGEITGDRLMKLYSQFTQWANYLSVQVAMADNTEEELEQDLKTAEALFMATQSDAGVKLNDARALRDGDESILTARKSLQVARHVRKLTSTLLGNCERSAAACSRELTRRTSGPYHERRSD